MRHVAARVVDAIERETVLKKFCMLHAAHTACTHNRITVTFHCEKDGSEHTVQAPIGKSLLEVAHANDIELEGACAVRRGARRRK